MLITKSELAARKGVTMATVAHWGRRGLLRMKNGKVDFEATETILAQRSPTRRRDRPRGEETPEQFVSRTVIDGGNAPYSTLEAIRIKENALARLREIEADIAAGESVKIVDIERELIAEYQILRTGLLSMASYMAPRLAHARGDTNVIKSILDKAASEFVDILGMRTEGVLDEAKLKQRKQDER
jgi:phage terminase Nu1 subunit (DNA packaging protein)